MSESRSVAVIVPTRDTCAATVRCVESVLESEVVGSCVVVDNASIDGTADELERRFPSVRVLRNTENAGFARACNQGAYSTAEPLLLFLNSDVVAERDAIDRLARFVERDHRFVAAAGKLVDPASGEPQVGFAIRAYPTLAAQIALLLGFERHWRANPVSRRQLMLDFDYGRTQELEAQPAGACLLVRRRAFATVGGFDEGFYIWFEDVDLLRRISHLGLVGYVHDAVFGHEGGLSFGRWSRREIIVERARSLVRYFSKHHSKPEQVMLRATLVLLGVIRAVPLLSFDRDRSGGYLDVARVALRQRPEPLSVRSSRWWLGG